MGSRSAQAAREAMAARVQAGELTASQAYALDKSGAFRKGYFEPYQEIAAKSKLGVWRSAPKAELKNAMSYNPSQEVASKATQRAEAAGIDPYGFNGVVPTPSLNPSPAKPTGYALQSMKGLDTGDRDAWTAEANQLRSVIRESYGSPEATRAEDRLNAIMNYLAEPSVFPAPTKNSPSPAPLPAANWVDEVWDNTPKATPEQMANRGNGSVTVGAQGNSVSDPKLQAGIIKDVDTNLGDRVEKMTKTVGNTDPTIAGSGRQVGGNNQGPASGPIEPTGQAALPAPTIGSGSVGTTDAVTKAVAALGKNADPFTVAQTVKQTVIAYGGSTDAATNMAAKVLSQRGIPLRDAIQVASSVPNSIAGSTAGPPAGFGSTAPGVTSNGVTGVNGQVSNAGTVTADTVTGMPGGSPPTPVVEGSKLVTGGTAAPAAAVPGATSTGGSALVNGGVGTGPSVTGLDPSLIIPAVGAVGAISSVLTGNAMADAQIRAAQIQASAANKAADLQKTMYDQSRTDLTPWRSAGEEALGYDRDVQGNLVERASGGLRTFEQDNPQFKSDPFKFDTNSRSPAYNDAYNFRLSEGLKALQSSAAAKGMLRSGNTMQAITQYGQGMASQEVDNEFNRYQTNRTNDFNIFNAQRGSKLNALQSLAGVGQSAVSQMTNAGQNYANNAGQAGMTAANATANGMTGAANDRASGWMGGIQTGMNALGMALNYGNQQNISNAFAKYYGS